MKNPLEWKTIEGKIENNCFKVMFELFADEFTYVINYFSGRINATCNRKEKDFDSIEEAKRWCEHEFIHKIAEEICDETIE